MNPERWGQVKSIFHRAVECDPEARPGFLREACGGDSELLREVESLLASENEPDSLLDHPVIPAGPAASAPPDPMVGRVIGNYRITGELARGGMGIVYRARHTTLPRDVVVKCIRPTAFAGDARDELRTRFRREAFIQSQLDHPHIVRVYEFFNEHDEYLLVMEYVPGQSIRSMLDRDGAVPPDAACALAVQALDGLAHAHGFRYVDEEGNTGAGIIHRDIKPANLLVDERGNLKLTDFGIAKALGQDQGTKTLFSPGTLDYMSPEQIRNQSVDARSDLYSLGVTLYEMLAGRVPFQSDLGSGYDALKAHIETDPPPIRTLNPAIPPVLADVVTRALDRDPDRRWQTAVEFRAALTACLERRPVPAPVLPAGPRPAPAGKRRRLMVAVGVAGLMLAAAAGAGLLRFGRTGKPAAERPSIAVLPFADMSANRDQEYFSDGLTEELLNQLARTPGLRVTGRTSSFRFKGKNEDLRSIGRQLNVTAILEGSVRKQGNQTRVTAQLIKTADGFHLWSATYDREMNDIFAVQEEIARAVTGALQVTLLGGQAPAAAAKRTNADAYNVYLQGKYFLEHRNQENLAKAAAYFEQAIGMDRGYAPAWVGLAESRIYQIGQAYIPVKEGSREAREALERALALDADLADAHAAMGLLKLDDWDWVGAEASSQRALALAPGSAKAISRGGSLARALGRLEEAQALFRLALEIEPLSPNIYLQSGFTLYVAGHYEEAEAAYKKALDLFPGRSLVHGLLGRVYLARSRPREALAEAQKEPDPVARFFGLALAYHALGQKKESDASLADLIRGFQAEALFQIAMVHAFRGQTELAFQWLERAYKEHDTGLADMKGNPLLKNLEGDPRYAAMLKRVGLPL